MRNNLYMALSRPEAIARVGMYVDATSYPELSTTDIGTIVDSFRRFTTWTASTVYAVGDRVVPTTPNGRVYECHTAGTSDTTEPDWPVNPRGQYSGWYTTDGTSNPALIWVDMGPANVEQYDIRSATRQGWLIKASRVVSEIDAKEGASDVKLSQLLAHCVSMAGKYRPLVMH